MPAKRSPGGGISKGRSSSAAAAATSPSRVRKGRSSSAAAAATSPSRVLNFKKLDHAALKAAKQQTKSSKPASSSTPVQAMTFGKHMVIARINAGAISSAWTPFPVEPIAILKALNMRGFRFEDSQGSGQKAE